MWIYVEVIILILYRFLLWMTLKTATTILLWTIAVPGHRDLACDCDD